MRHLWEFPGGKVEHGESASMALNRELEEELGISGLEAEHFQRIEHDYPDLKVSIDFFIVSSWRGAPTGIEGQRLRWVDAYELEPGLLLPADAPVVTALRNWLKQPFSKC
jgi:8-oxo-dGTP diphosphatase